MILIEGVKIMATDVAYTQDTNVFLGGAKLPLISVIVPCYNAKKYLKQAVESILNQTFKEFEIILVDDCSTDGTYEYMKSLWDDSAIISVVRNKKNMGPALTRNYGIRISRGKYLAFMDSDDCYLPDFLKNLYYMAESHQADVVSCMGFFHSEKESIPEDLSCRVIPDLDSNYRQEIVFAPEGVRERVEGWLRNEYNIACWNKLYLRDFLMYHDISFKEDSEDRGFAFACLLNAKMYVKTPYIGNIYRRMEVSFSRNANLMDLGRLGKTITNLDGFAQDFMDIMKEFTFFEEHPEYCGIIISHQLSIIERANVLQYFPQSNAISTDVYRASHEALQRIFGEHTPLAEFLFMQYQVQARKIAEFAER